LKYLVTGSSGFIGFHLCKHLCEQGFEVHGIDNHNTYYDVKLKENRRKHLLEFGNFSFFNIDINDFKSIKSLFKKNSYKNVIHLAAQAGVRYSLKNPMTYGESNLIGFLNVLEVCKSYPPDLFIFASSSSVYGNSNKFPLKEDDSTDKPSSLYAATKKANELLAYTYSDLYNIKTVGLRFFTVYGPFGRPDMAYFSFTKSIIENKPIKVFNNGNLFRDFTYIKDIIEGIIAVLNMDEKIKEKENYFNIYNLGSGNPINLLNFIEILENTLGKKAKIIYQDMQPGDVFKTFADMDKLSKDTDFRAKTSFEEGISNFVSWYKEFYK
jgi:UDP-glucuronate 4-epimerase